MDLQRSQSPVPGRSRLLWLSMARPSVVYPAALGLLAAATALLAGDSTILWVAGGGLGLALGMWVYHGVVRREDLLQQSHDQRAAALAQQRQARMRQLAQTLHAVGSKEGVRQYQQLKEKFGAFQKMLAKKLHPEELTYARYLGVAEQVHLAAVENLQRIADALSGLSAVDQDYLLARLKELGAADSEHEARELAALQERVALRESRLQQVQAYLASNEEAMTELDRTTAAIAQIHTSDTTMTLEFAMQELQRLADRAKEYSV